MEGGWNPRISIGADFNPVVLFAHIDQCIEVNGGCTLPLSVAKNNGHEWSVLGNLDGFVSLGGLGRDSQGQLVVAGLTYDSAAQSYSVRAASWNGSAWAMSSNSLLPIRSDFKHLVFSTSGRGMPALVWDATSGPSSELIPALWTGTFWDETHGVLDLSSSTGYPSNGQSAIIADAAGRPVVTWSSGGTGAVAQWNGTALIPSPTLSTSASSLALDESGAPLMIEFDAGKYFVTRFSGSAWQRSIDSPIPMDSTAFQPQLSVGIDGNVAVVWFDSGAATAVTPEYNIGVARWTGMQWDARAGLFNAGGKPYDNQQIVVDGRGSSWIAWSETTDSADQSYVWMSNY